MQLCCGHETSPDGGMLLSHLEELKTNDLVGLASAPDRGCPSHRTGLTMVASTANCWPCQSGSPLHTTSMRRASWRGICQLMSAKRTFCATRAPKASKAPPHGVSGKGSRNLRSSSTQNCALEISWVGNTVKARAACGPACESSSAWDARDGFPKCVASARSSHAWAACLCQPRMKFGCSSSFPADTSRVSPHAGASYPWACR